MKHLRTLFRTNKPVAFQNFKIASKNHNNVKEISIFFSSIFDICTVHLDAIKSFYLPTDAQQKFFKRILKFTLKQLLHVSVSSPPSSAEV